MLLVDTMHEVYHTLESIAPGNRDILEVFSEYLTQRPCRPRSWMVQRGDLYSSKHVDTYASATLRTF